jgi:peptidoglycan/LPS O-acetylase OafA/YrhL
VSTQDSTVSTQERPAPAQPRTSRFPCFDGLRAIAVLAVLVVHTSYVTGVTGRTAFGTYIARLEVGVPIFFMISGFLLYRPFVSSHFQPSAGPGWRTFWGRRILRVVPAYWVVMTLSVYWLHTAEIGHGVGAAITFYGFGQIYYPALALHGLSQAWTLCTEMSFYLLLPFYAWALGYRRRTVESQLRAELIGVASLVVVSVVFRAVMYSIPNRYTQSVSGWLPTNLDPFALGMLLAVLSVWWTKVRPESKPQFLDHRRMPASSWAAAVVFFFIVCHIGIGTNPLFHLSASKDILRMSLEELCAFFLLVPAVFGPQDRGLVRWSLRWRPIAWIGIVSYGIYLWHQSWIDLFFRWHLGGVFLAPWWQLTLFALATATATASISYLLMERPILSMKRWLPLQRTSSPNRTPAVKT